MNKFENKRFCKECNAFENFTEDGYCLGCGSHADNVCTSSITAREFLAFWTDKHPDEIQENIPDGKEKPEPPEEDELPL